MKKNVIVGMSGGVDSSVAAYLLKKEGYNVIGIHIVTSIKKESEINDAQKVCDTLNIPLYIIDVTKEFKENVIEYFVSEYQLGRTPSPCTVCNRTVKWPSILHSKLDINADYIATGHYADIVHLDNGRYAIKHSATDSKDQTYMLYNLTQEQLKKTLFPLAKYEKDEVRKIAININARIASKSDSQEICFIPDDDYVKFIEEYTNTTAEPGDFVDLDNKILGKHNGIIKYTVGQRKGININLNRRAFVINIDAENNKITLGDNEDTFAQGCIADSINFMGIENIDKPIRCAAKCRYSQKPHLCTIEKINNQQLKCIFDDKQRAITNGQSLVFYDGDVVLGGGRIISIIK
jgi:tRNA-specific 2-thiouridylase